MDKRIAEVYFREVQNKKGLEKLEEAEELLETARRRVEETREYIANNEEQIKRLESSIALYKDVNRGFCRALRREESELKSYERNANLIKIAAVVCNMPSRPKWREAILEKRVEPSMMQDGWFRNDEVNLISRDQEWTEEGKEFLQICKSLFE